MDCSLRWQGYYSLGDPDEALALSCRSGGLHTEDKKCGLHFSTSIMIFVCVLNLLKCLLICWTAYYTSKSELLVTAGDALVSFLQAPSPHSRHVYEFKTGIPEKSSPEFWAQKMGSSKREMVSCRRSMEMGHGFHIVSLLNPTDPRKNLLNFLSPPPSSCIIVLIFVTFFLAADIA